MIAPLVRVTPPPLAVLEDLPGFPDPLVALRSVRHRRHPVLLFSAPQGHPAARFSILAWDPHLVVSIRGGEAVLVREDDERRSVESRVARDPFDLLRALAPAEALRRTAPGLPFVGGAIGYIGYGLRRSVERLSTVPPDPLGLPDAWFGLYDRAVVFDQHERRAVLVATGLGAENERQRETRAARGLRDLRRSLLRATPEPASLEDLAPAARRPARLLTNRAEYVKAIARALEYIAAGDVYQVNLSHRIECPFEGDPLSLFVDLARRNPAPFAAYLDAGGFQVVSASPERFVSLSGDRVRSSPIKGTRPRGATPARDERLARELLSSEKDRAENVMIADLVRNDLGRVCQAGSVRIDGLCALESFATVHHLVTTVTGRLRPDADRIDLLRALFPGGSMTGAPKVRAMEIIDELEGEERGVYSGCVGYLSLDGGMDFNIVIRTLLCFDGRAHLRVGGAIVADSDPGGEYAETLDKARALLEVLNADLTDL